MKELVEYIVKQIVNKPDDVLVEEVNDNGSINLSLKVNQEDMGMVIGKAGQTIKSIRKLLIAKAIVDNVRVNLTLIDQTPATA